MLITLMTIAPTGKRSPNERAAKTACATTFVLGCEYTDKVFLLLSTFWGVLLLFDPRLLFKLLHWFEFALFTTGGPRGNPGGPWNPGPPNKPLGPNEGGPLPQGGIPNGGGPRPTAQGGPAGGPAVVPPEFPPVEEPPPEPPVEELPPEPPVEELPPEPPVEELPPEPPVEELPPEPPVEEPPPEPPEDCWLLFPDTPLLVDEPPDAVPLLVESWLTQAFTDDGEDADEPETTLLSVTTAEVNGLAPDPPFAWERSNANVPYDVVCF
jgi:hypothetical protein